MTQPIEISNIEAHLSYPSVRSATEADINAIVQFAYLQELEFKKHDPQRQMPSLGELKKRYAQRILNRVEGFCYGVFVAEENHELRGLVFGRVPVNRKICYALLQGIYVDPEARGKGVAELLAARMIQFAKQAGAVDIKGDVYTGSKGLAFFEGRRGWQRENINGNLIRLRLPIS